MTQMRDWNKPIRVFVAITWVQYVFVIFISYALPKGSANFYKHTFEVLGLPLYWLSLPPTLALIYIPFYLERIYW